MPELITLNQTTFVKGRSIIENILLEHELVRGYSRKNLSPRCSLKIDLHKAFDSVNWRSIFAILKATGLPMTFIKWIETCYTTASYSVSINGSLSGYFKGAKDLRQGDPLSPFLFVLSMNILSLLLNMAALKGIFSYQPNEIPWNSVAHKKNLLKRLRDPLDKHQTRLHHWSSKMLSYAGRLELIRTLCSRFFWKGSDKAASGARVSWNKICSLKSEGGIGIKDMKTWNKACMFTLIKQILAGEGSLWVAWLHKYVIKDNDFLSVEQVPYGILSGEKNESPMAKTVCSWDAFLTMACSKWKGKSMLSFVMKIALNALVYLLWEERCRRQFQGRTRTSTDLLKIFKEIIRSVKVSNVPLGASDNDIREFFIFSGEIEYVEMHMRTSDHKLHTLLTRIRREQRLKFFFQYEPVSFLTSYDIGIKQEYLGKMKSRIYLISQTIQHHVVKQQYMVFVPTGATIVDQFVTIELASDYKLHANAFTTQATGDSGQAKVVYTKAEDVVSTMLAKGFIIGIDALNKAKSFDEKHQVTSNASAKIASLDQKIGFSKKISAGSTVVNEKMREMDQKYQVSEKSKTALAAAEQSVSPAKSSIMKSRYALAGAAWFTAAYKRDAKAAEDVGQKTREKVLAEEQAQNPEDSAHMDVFSTPRAGPEASVQPSNPSPNQVYSFSTVEENRRIVHCCTL
ncbi:RNA-binding family protein isoform 2 [Hibiscus syriacus]|uniref:RNA-binding family protein isoform 2 n=1 Tax=Hibiscus syriacus TaxID=106335 RepID=A0A6A2XTT2_HIBSY|nr:RNA-binding family protein isoform 2 [Hibiscus syriacus]